MSCGVNSVAHRRLTPVQVEIIGRKSAVHCSPAVGLKVRPHGLRHAAITSALDATGGDVRRVSRFSRHRDIKTVMVYDDARADLGGEVAALVACGTMRPMEPREPWDTMGDHR